MAWPETGGFSKEQYPFACCYDPASGRTVQFLFQRYLAGAAPEALSALWRTGRQTFFDHNFWQVSDDEGRTWSEMRQLRYEAGGHDDSGRPGDPTYLTTNQMYGAYTAVPTRQGTVVYPASGVPMQTRYRGRDETVSGVLCFIGTWDAARETYHWDVSKRICVPHRVSGRGLLEPAVAELTDGRLLLEMRGSTMAIESEWKGKTECPGRRWISVSEDGGRSWSEVADLRYDTGEQFYSPSALAMLLRHSGTGKLYWFGNITPSPPEGNLPRYPLYVAEIDETLPALKRDTLTVIDDYDRDHDSSQIQLSNFKLFENRATGDIELYMTRLGERASHWLHASAYKYTLTLQ